MNQNKETQPNLIIIKKGELYYNGPDNHFYTQLANATWCKNPAQALAIIQSRNLIGAVPVKISEHDYTYAKANAMTKIILLSETLSKYLHEVGSNLPTKSQVNKLAAKQMKLTSQQLMLINPDFNHFLKVREDDTFDVLGHFEAFIQELSQVELYDTPNLTGILQAYKKDPKSVIGICKKILK
ncbi:hypothetical protein [Flavobacterium sp. HSC-61S13]|uniref:hypothetical protein n=1 Tax=Flavobacterium sp. HSC-61S13 TaxID=2910963 RepID=UPI00209D5364|nr:hypothetical protein [Flavobacterium sp. HSC-61S13]MCP1996631.1 hypothetical protein [Flavobacterium sp. HSC-61S13]